jgi:hypothetical protein
MVMAARFKAALGLAADAGGGLLGKLNSSWRMEVGR